MSAISQRINQTFAPVQAYWQGMPAKDRRALTILAAIALPVAIIWGGILPAKNALTEARLAQQKAVQLVSEIRSKGPSLRGGSSQRIPEKQLAQRVQALAASQKLTLDRLEADPAGVRIALNNVSVTQLTLFLQQCRAQGVAVKEVVISHNGEGLSQARVRLSV